MKDPKTRRLVGYALWAIGLFGLLPPSLLATGNVGIQQFLLFSAMVVLLFSGFLLVDSANTALQRTRDHSLNLGHGHALADKHFHPPAPVPEMLEDHQPDDLPAARSLVGIVMSLLVVSAVVWAVIYYAVRT